MGLSSIHQNKHLTNQIISNRRKHHKQSEDGSKMADAEKTSKIHISIHFSLIFMLIDVIITFCNLIVKRYLETTLVALTGL